MSKSSPGNYCPTSEEWDRYQERFERYLHLRDMDRKHKEKLKEADKTAILITEIGGDVFAVLCGLCAPKRPKEFTVVELLGKLSLHYQTKYLKIPARHKLFTCKQTSGESLQLFANTLRQLASRCSFPDNVLNDMLSTAFVMGILNNETRIQLFREKDDAVKTLDDAIKIAEAVEMTKNEVCAITENATIHVISSRELSVIM